MEKNLQTIRQDNINTFRNYLAVRGYSDATKLKYTTYYKPFRELVEEYGLTQELVDGYIKLRKGGKPVRAFASCYLKFIGNREIEIAKRTGRIPKKRIDIPTNEEVLNIIKWFYNRRQDKMAIGVLLAYRCGLRRQEVCDISLGDFNLEQFVDNPFNGTILKIHGKGGKERYVVVPSDVINILKVYIKDHRQKIETNDLTWKTPLLGISPQHWQMLFHEACKKLGYKPYTIHKLRHARTTIWYEKGVDIYKIRDRLGHGSVATTEQYIHPSETKSLKEWLEEVK